jgi:hypothetical protein
MERAVTLDAAAGVWKLSWLAYVRPLVLYGLLISLAASISFIPWWVTALLLARLVYRLAYLWSIRIVLDEQGIWKHSGLFPWSKGASGVKWRDLDQAQLFMGFVPWMTNSHTVHIGHRFTKASELIVRHVHDGRGLIEAVNSEHDKLARIGGLS